MLRILLACVLIFGGQLVQAQTSDADGIVIPATEYERLLRSTDELCRTRTDWADCAVDAIVAVSVCDINQFIPGCIDGPASSVDLADMVISVFEGGICDADSENYDEQACRELLSPQPGAITPTLIPDPGELIFGATELFGGQRGLFEGLVNDRLGEAILPYDVQGNRVWLMRYCQLLPCAPGCPGFGSTMCADPSSSGPDYTVPFMPTYCQLAPCLPGCPGSASGDCAEFFSTSQNGGAADWRQYMGGNIVMPKFCLLVPCGAGCPWESNGMCQPFP